MEQKQCKEISYTEKYLQQVIHRVKADILFKMASNDNTEMQKINEYKKLGMYEFIDVLKNEFGFFD